MQSCAQNYWNNWIHDITDFSNHFQWESPRRVLLVRWTTSPSFIEMLWTDFSKIYISDNFETWNNVTEFSYIDTMKLFSGLFRSGHLALHWSVITQPHNTQTPTPLLYYTLFFTVQTVCYPLRPTDPQCLTSQLSAITDWPLGYLLSPTEQNKRAGVCYEFQWDYTGSNCARSFT